MDKTYLQTVTVHPQAPAKPATGAQCNGCGVCCAAESCPVAMVFLWQWRGACRALVWQDESRRYVCGMVLGPEQHVHFLPRYWVRRLGGFFAARISAGSGCDFDAQVQHTPRV